MLKKLNKIFDPQQLVEQARTAVVLSNKIKLSLYKKSVNSGISANILEEVYCRGYTLWNDKFKGSKEQFAFDRVNSFIAGGFAADLDRDLIENTDVPTPSVKSLAQKHNSSIKKIKTAMRVGAKIEAEHTKNKKDAEEIARDHLGEKPNYYKLLKQYVESEELHSKYFKKPNSRFDGSDELVNVYKNCTPGQKVLSTIKRIRDKNEK